MSAFTFFVLSGGTEPAWQLNGQFKLIPLIHRHFFFLSLKQLLCLINPGHSMEITVRHVVMIPVNEWIT